MGDVRELEGGTVVDLGGGRVAVVWTPADGRGLGARLRVQCRREADDGPLVLFWRDGDGARGVKAVASRVPAD